MKENIKFEFTIEKSDISSVCVSSFSHSGARTYQEDSFGYNGPFKAGYGGNAFCAVLSDGMGGLSNGDKVSSYAVSSYIKRLCALKTDNAVHKEFIRITNEVNNRVVSGGYGGGATVVALYCCHRGIFFCSTGDSRLYLFRGNALTQLTEDFDVLNRELGKVIDGIVTYTQADTHEERDNLTEFIGAGITLSPDVNIKPLIPQKGDRLLICSDGVYNALSEEELIYCLSADAATAAMGMESAIIEKAIPIQDNATAIVLEFR